MDASDKLRPSRPRSSVILKCLLFVSLAVIGYAPPAQSQSVITYHYDNLRTGWNASETTLTPTNVPNLQLVASVNCPGSTVPATVCLDEQVDAQPLLVTGVTIAGGKHDVLYVATENNTVYALDAATGATLATRNFGASVPQKLLPGHCSSNSQNVGIGSTPVIDPTHSAMYVMVYSYENNTPIYRLHAIDLATLNDKVAPAVVSASARLSTGGGIYNFNPSVSRQRSGLLIAANGNIYAAFASFCDVNANLSRGWLLGWQSASLTPLRVSYLDNLLSNSTNDIFLSTIWMSGYGVAADSSSNLYFSTGNSDYSGTSYSTRYNLSESIVKISPDLKTVVSFFTPSDATFGVKYLDQTDGDFSSGGVLLLPDQPGFSQGLAVAAGKVGQMYLLNRSNLGGYSSSQTNNVVGVFSIGNCWCGQSYFQGWDAAGRVVSSGGDKIIVWKLQTSPGPTLVQESVSPALTSGQDGGFFTTVSSASTPTTNVVIWAVGRPVDINPANVTLYAFDPLAASQGSTSWLFSTAAGTWPNSTANANIVPVVANGHVYVASYKQLNIFGLAGAVGATPQTTAQAEAQTTQTATQDSTELPPNGHEIFGTISSIDGDRLSIATRSGSVINVNATEALQNYHSVVLLVDEPVRILGSFDPLNVLQATVITRVKPSPALWPPDR